MSTPLTVTVDLAKLGMLYDEDGDPTGRQTFEDAVIEAAAAKLLADTKESRHALKERVARIRDEELRDEDLPRGSVEDAVAAGEVSVEEIVEAFRVKLLEVLGEDT